MDEKQLVNLAKTDRNAMNTLLANHHHIVYGFLLQMTCNQELSKDLTQDTMIKAILNINKFKGNSKFSTWLIAIAINTYKNYTKKHKGIHIEFDEHYASNFDLEKDLIIKEEFHQVMSLLNNMKDSQKMPFLLKHYYGYSYDKISRIMKCPIGTVRSRIHNTIKKIQDSMGGLNELQIMRKTYSK